MWQPIETAPKDGPYLVFGSIHGSLFGVDHGPMSPRIHWCEGGVFAADGREGRFLIERGEDYEYGYATHWLPLPADPQ
jgi:hypothetical protein